MNYYRFDTNQTLNTNRIGVTVGDIGWSFGPRKEEDYELIAMVSGTSIFNIDDEKYTVKEGDIILLPPHQINSNYTTGETACKYYYIHFTIDNLVSCSYNTMATELNTILKQLHPFKNEFFFRLPLIGQACIFIPEHYQLNNDKSKLWTIFEKALYERNHYSIGSKGLIDAYLMEMLILIYRTMLSQEGLNNVISEKGTTHQKLELMIKYIHHNYTNRITLDELSEQFELSKQYIIRLFKERYHQTPIQYIQQYRLYMAKKLMHDSDLTISEIAYQVGFSNPFYFSRLFKRYEGVTPSELRKGIYSRSNN